MGLWRTRHVTMGLGDHVRIMSRPFRSRPTADDWRCLVETGDPPELFVVDPLVSFLPGDESSPLAVSALFDPLRTLASEGTAVLVLHHPRKGSSTPRGCAAIGSSADVTMEMTAVGRYSPTDRRRRLTLYSRFPETPPVLVVEWTQDGRDFTSVELEDRPPTGWDAVRSVLSAGGEMTRQEVMGALPEEMTASSWTLARWLDQAERTGLVTRSGDGRKHAPYRYRLVSRDAQRSAADYGPSALRFASRLTGSGRG